MKVEILMPGKIADKPYQKLIELYLERCSRRLPVEIVNCRNEEELLRRLAGRECIVALDEHAKCHDTNGFCQWLETKINSGVNRMTFCLGAAEGHDPRVRAAATEFISLSPLTLNHQLALLVIAEQLYRAVSIMFGEPYHKA
ncbi:MAG TPA: 23S rRNA (pseudouridine(1915)-N(3))-methyltransferase RlmH [Candidatus Ozemobacteraceae bacterium]|nr:23S rRNA (pseudouridine(1915)-N(3))-methyltransferase RlmH [Candidatus Ozemobacteraceae bacterium]HNW10195.1 23S rRNA (pseudouridine(1915)-N(3))-methyltransferase RlmH [Candidatus Rifleibacterium sp.]